MSKKRQPVETVETIDTPVVVVEVPVGAPPDAGYQSTMQSAIHVDVVFTTIEQRSAMLFARSGLIAAGEKLENGRLVLTNADVVRWVMEKIHRGVE